MSIDIQQYLASRRAARERRLRRRPFGWLIVGTLMMAFFGYCGPHARSFDPNPGKVYWADRLEHIRQAEVLLLAVPLCAAVGCLLGMLLEQLAKRTSVAEAVAAFVVLSVTLAVMTFLTSP